MFLVTSFLSVKEQRIDGSWYKSNYFVFKVYSTDFQLNNVNWKNLSLNKSTYRFGFDSIAKASSNQIIRLTQHSSITTWAKPGKFNKMGNKSIQFPFPSRPLEVGSLRMGRVTSSAGTGISNGKTYSLY